MKNDCPETDEEMYKRIDRKRITPKQVREWEQELKDRTDSGGPRTRMHWKEQER